MVSPVVAVAILLAAVGVRTALANAWEPQRATCVSSLTQSRCAADGQFIEIDARRNACPRCRGGLGLGKTKCNARDRKRRCAPGLQCLNSQCVLDRTTPASGCTFSHHLRHLRNVPQCLADGTFAAVQCKGDMLYGRCFCADERGRRIFGFAWRRDAGQMTCACSRLRATLESHAGQATDLHCAANGNFEPLQCDGGVCWCVDERTGRMNATLRAVPLTMWKLLPCYEAATMGDQYSRQCESVRMAQTRMQAAMRARGTLEATFKQVNCNYGGSFGTYRVENGISTCVSADGKRIDSFQVPATATATQNCYCAQDRQLFRAVGSELAFACAGNGNYDTVQLVNGRPLCVDADGFAVSGLMNSTAARVLDDCRELLYEWVVEAEVD